LNNEIVVLNREKSINQNVMKAYNKYFKLALLIAFFSASCTKHEIESDFSNDTDLIKSEISNDKIISNYKYNNIGKIAEKEGIYFYCRYLYDNKEKLVKIETAVDLSILSSSLPIEKTELMTAENCTISSYQVLKYDQSGK